MPTVYKTAIKPAMVYGVECWAARKQEEWKLHTTEMRMLRWARGTKWCEKCRHLERGTHVPDGRIPQIEEVEMVWTCAEARWRWCHKEDITDDNRWKAISRQTKTEMARPGEIGYGQKPDDDWDGGGPKTLACHDPNRHTTKCWVG